MIKKRKKKKLIRSFSTTPELERALEKEKKLTKASISKILREALKEYLLLP